MFAAFKNSVTKLSFFQLDHLSSFRTIYHWGIHMMSSQKLVIITVLFFCAAVCAQVTIRPFYGFYKPRLGDVNAKIEADIIGWRNLIGEPIPGLSGFGGNRSIGGQIRYPISEEDFLAVNIGYYQEEQALTHIGGAGLQNEFLYQREIEMYDFVFNLHHFINYSSWRPFNYYIGLGVGLVVVRANSVTRSDFTENSLDPGSPPPLTDTVTESNGNNLSGLISSGFTLRVNNYLEFWAEGGLQYANIGELEGTLTRINGDPINDYVTNSSFDLTGFYARAGAGFTLPFLN